jgi:glycosyltransferase involved in cell wall biosynthesis
MRLLNALDAQDTGGLFTYSILVVDNDRLESARTAVADFAASASVPVRYCVEPRRGIGFARNAAADNAAGDYVALIDDDEQPIVSWLVELVGTIDTYRADGVLGPVVPHFCSPPADWIVRGRFFDRPSFPTGTCLRWKQTRAGNVLLRASIFDDERNRFRVDWPVGEDVEFFRRMTAAGMQFVWCDEAAVHEAVVDERCRRKYLLKLALLRGMAPSNQGWQVVKSLAAVPVYALMLPVLLVFGHHVFVRYLIKECHHVGRLLRFVRWRRPLELTA